MKFSELADLKEGWKNPVSSGEAKHDPFGVFILFDNATDNVLKKEDFVAGWNSIFQSSSRTQQEHLVHDIVWFVLRTIEHGDSGSKGIDKFRAMVSMLKAVKIDLKQVVEPRKNEIVTRILKNISAGVDYKAKKYITCLKTILRLNWPELDTIQKSLYADDKK